MVNTNIQQLNKYCLFEILKLITNNEVPELDMANKYKDLINFALSCVLFRDAVREWNSDLYATLQIEEIYLITSKGVYVDFDKIYERLQGSTQKAKDLFWHSYMNALKSNTKLKGITLIYKSEEYNRDHGEILNLIMDALQNKPKLRSLVIKMKGYCLNGLPQLRNINDLDIDLKISVSDLVDFCKSNKSLNVLSIMNNEIYGKLADIVPHCEELTHLYFLIKTDFHDSEYTQLAKLPKLVYLNIRGKHESGSLSALIMALAAKESHTLERLFLETHIKIPDFLEACKIPSLQKLLCRISNINNFRIVIDRVEGNNQLTFHCTKEKNATDLDFLSYVPKLKELVNCGSNKIGTLKPLFKAIAEKESPKLEILLPKHCYFLNNDFNYHVDINLTFPFDDTEEETIKKRRDQLMLEEKLDSDKISMLNNDEVLEILKIKSLKSLAFILSDNQPMPFPTHLPQITTIRIKSQIKGSLENLFKAFAQQIPSKLNSLNIYDYPLSVEESMEILKIKTLTEFRCNSAHEVYRSFLNPFKRLCFNRHDLLYDSFETLFKFFKSSKETSIKINKHLRTLTIKSRERIYTVIQELVMEENHIAAKIAELLTFRNIMCANYEPQSIQYFKNLPKLETLNIKSIHNFPDISQGILHVLNGYSDNIIVKLHDRQITFNKSLGKLSIVNILIDFNGQEYVPLAQLEHLRSLHIKGNPMRGSFQYLFSQFIQNPTIEEIICNGNINFNYDEVLELSNIASLKRLKCGFNDGKCFDALQNLRNLQDLTIASYPEDSLTQFLEVLASREYSNLQALNLSGNTLSFEAIAQIAKLNSLNRLKCEFADPQNIEQLAKLNQLEELTINAYKCSSLLTLFKALNSTESENLQKLEITHRPILYKEMTIIVQFKNLRKLFCELKDTKNIQLLIQLPELRELSLYLLNSETEGIEILTQLNKLTHLEIKSPKSGSLTELFKQLSAREIPILETLIIKGHIIDYTEMEAIAQLKTLKRLQCELDHDNYECLADLLNLEVIEITPWIHYNSFSINNSLLSIMQKCHKINTIVVYKLYEINVDFFQRALQILKTVRNPELQDALRLRCLNFEDLLLEEINLLDESYFIIEQADLELDFKSLRS